MKLRNKDTGEIDDFIIFDDLEIITGEHWIGVRRVIGRSDVPQNIWHFRTLKDLFKTFEDYTPKEPLITDEKIRKAVRAWAEALDTESCNFRADHDIFDFIGCGANCLRFDMSDGFDTYKLEDIESGYYHITELCGEDER